jgi:hypothetical protein
LAAFAEEWFPGGRQRVVLGDAVAVLKLPVQIPARHATVRMVSVSARKMGLAISFRRSGVPTVSTTAPE